VGERGAYRLADAIDEIEIPASVQALLAARIDRLPGDDKALLQSAAVIGREFSEPVLRQVAGLSESELASSLAALVRAELVYERRLYPDVWYAFKHPLTQDVAYGSQLREQRVRAHAATARALEEFDSDATDELAALISDHWERANEPLAAAQWATRAATWAGPRHAEEALRHWRRVRTLVGDRRDTPAAGLALAARVWIVYGGWRLGVPDDELELTYREALELAEASGDKLAMAMVRSAYGMARGSAGALEEAIPIAHESRRLAAEAGNLELEVSISPALWLHFAGRNREAVIDFERTLKTADGDLQLGRQLIGASAVVYATIFRGAALMEMGRLREAHAAAAEGLRLAREVDDFELVGTAHGLFGILSLLTGEPDDGLAHAREGLALGDRLGSTLARVTVRLLLAAAHLACDQCDDAGAVASEGLELIRGSRSGMQAEDQLLSQLAMARLGRGDLAGARTAAAEGVALAARRGMRVHEALCRSALGTALLQDSPGEAKAELERAIELAGEDGALHVGPSLVALAAVAGIQNDEPERLRRLEEAHRLLEQQGATGHARRIAAHIAAAAA
jgi:tetratricopeptide (TPR) repeat protein